MASFPGNTPGITVNNFPRPVVRLVDDALVGHDVTVFFRGISQN